MCYLGKRKVFGEEVLSFILAQQTSCLKWSCNHGSIPGLHTRCDDSEKLSWSSIAAKVVMIQLSKPE